MGKKSKLRKKARLADSRKAGGAKSPVASPRLQFPPGEICGLTPVSLSVSGDKNPPSIVREILQNSLDAAKAAKRDCARVRFSVGSVAVSSIPGIEEYGNALDKVGEFCEQIGWPSQSRDIFDSLKSRLAEDSLPVMFVADNGIGLNSVNMEAMLSDGVNLKENPGASGSKGNGHFTTFNLSGLRYVLYGGVSEKDGKLASGHAILSSHQGESDICGKDGYYVAAINRKFPRYDFVKGGDIPRIISDKLQTIESEWETGALLAILDFDYFGEKESFNDAANLILGAAVRNFFVAVERGDLVVDICADKERKTLDAQNLQQIMQEISPDIGTTPKFPSHDKAERFYRIFVEGENRDPNVGDIEIKTGGGTFRLLYRTDGVASTKIALCRNGMWITDKVPALHGHFADNAPFEALLLCDEISVSELVCRAENNLHNSLNSKMITDKQKRKKFLDALREVREVLQAKIPKQPEESDDFLEVEGPGSIGAGPGRNTPPRGEKIGPVSLRSKGGTSNGKKSGKKSNSAKSAKPGSGINARCIAVRSNNTMKVRLVPQESLKSSQEAELRLFRNGGGDFTCDNPSENTTRIRLSKVVCNGKACAVDGDGFGVHIGAISEGENKVIEIEFENPQAKGDYKVDCELIRRDCRS